MITLEGPKECHNCGCNLYESCGEYEEGEMSGKMMITFSDNYQVYSRADDGENIYFEIDDPEYFEVEPSRLMVKVPLGAWAYLAKDFIKKHERHFVDNKQQMELDLC